MTQPPLHDPQQPAWGQPGPYGPQPPKKKLGTGAIIAIVLGSLLGVLVCLGILGAIVGDPETAANGKPDSPPPAPTTSSAPTTPSRTPTPAPTTIEPEPTTAPLTTKPAPTTPPPTTSAPPAARPAEPNSAARQAFLEALNTIDPRIIKPGKEDQAVSRGINQCSSIRTTKDEGKLAELALSRFTVDTRLPEIANAETGRRITHAARTHLCPGS
ncbi:hypothetical protein [Streptomyces sp. SID5770]|uniref:hypothetical protein n=1 Tax=Streptomyces sp. SID5770 TaxID=2690308 RepID=UPI0019252F95|nr:hypothetical protein [Streptomyces sp. SID5770]